MIQSQSTTQSLGTEKLSKLLLRYAIPSIIAMTASSLYNMADSIFIGHGVGPLAIAGLAITMPLMNLMSAFGSMVGIGASSLMSIKLGQNDRNSATSILGNVILLNTIIGLSLGLFCLLFLNQILTLFGASPDTLPYARDYMAIILSGNVFTHLYLGMNDSLRASGYPQKAMAIMLTAVLTNVALDALFVLGFKWGIAGAAWATVIAQVLAMSLEFIHFFDKKHYIHFSHGIFRLRAKIVRGILSIGMAPFLMNVCASIVVIFINKALKETGGEMGDLYVGAYGIVNRVVFIFIMIVIGLNQGMQPIVGYNFGARKFDRVKRTLRMVICIAVCITTSGFLICQLLPRTVAMMFTTDATLLEISEGGLRIVTLVFPLVGFQMVSTNFFQSIGKAHKAIFLSLTRQMLFLLPMLIILPPIFGTKGVWMSMPIADTLATIFTAILLANQFRKFHALQEAEKQLQR